MLTGIAGAQTPLAAFDGTPLSGTSPLTVRFNDTSTGSPSGWAWYFGDENFTASWTQQTPNMGWNRTSHSSVVTPDGNILLMGGYDGSDLNDTWRSTNKGATWTPVNMSSGWVARYSHNSVVTPDGSIVLFGGTKSNESESGAPPLAQMNDGFAIDSTRMPVGAIPDPSNYQNDTWRSTDNGTTWIQVNSSSGWTARYVHKSVVLPDGSIVLIGGYDGRYLNDTWRSTDLGSTWTRLTARAEWPIRSSHSSVALPDGSIILTGGFNGNYLNDTWRSTDRGATWTRLSANAPWTARYGHTSVVLPDGSIVLMGGFTGTGFTNDLWRSKDNGATWTRVSASAGWSARYMHTSVVLPDSSIVLMGGYNGPKTDAWRFVSAGSSGQNPSHTYTVPGIYSVALQAYNTDGFNSTRKTGYITVNSPPAGSLSNIGVFRPSAQQFIFNTTPVTRNTFGLSTDIPITGDWNGDGTADIGVFRPSARQFIFNTAPVTRTTFGLSTDIPITGDWNGDGTTDIGVFRPSAQQFIFNTTPVTRITFGLSTDIPITGDWNGDSITDIGVFRPSARQFIFNTAPVTRTTFGLGTDLPITGKWV